MQADLAADFPVVTETYAEASGILGLDLWSLVQEGPAEKLAATTVTQPAMLCAGVAAFRVWKELGGAAPVALSGHSLGEYSALVAGEAIAFDDAVRVVKRRSELMQEAVPSGVGAMAAILGLEDDAVVGVCNDASGDEVCEAVNFNSPGQVVVAGHKSAVDRAIEMASAAGARRAVLLPVSVPSHSSLMREAGEKLAEALADAKLETPATTVISAVDAQPYSAPDDTRARLSAQVYRPVRWPQAVNALVALGAGRVIECGPGKILMGLNRRIDKQAAAGALHSLDDMKKALENMQ